MKKDQLRVLLVEDDEDDFLLTRDLLDEITMFDCRTQWAANYAAAKKAFAENAFDVCLIDYRLGEHTGLELLREACAEGFRAPMILLTGQDDRAVDLEAMGAGAADYLIKGRIESALLERSIRYALERRRAEDVLEAAAIRERAMIENALDVICTIDEAGRFVMINPACLKMLGYRPEELIGRHFIEFVAPDDITETKAVAARILAGEEVSNFENRYRHKNGTFVNLAWTSHWSETERLMFAVAHDITERKRTEAALMLESSLMQALLDNIPDAIYFKDTASRFVRVGKHGHWRGIESPEDAVGKTDFDFYGEEHARVAFEDEQRIVRTGEPLVDKIEKEVFHDGSFGWVSSTKVPIFDQNGKVSGIAGVSRDISERMRIEEALRENEAKFRDLFDNAPVAYHELDIEGHFRRVNRTEELLLGYTEEELKGRHCSEIIVEKNSRDAVTAKLAGKMPLHPTERTFIRKDGTLVSVLNEDRLIYDADGAVIGVRSTLQDITGLKRAEKILQESELRYRRLFEGNPNPNWIWDVETLEFLAVNEKAIRVFGYSREEFQTITTRDLPPPEDSAIFQEYLAQAEAGVEKFHSVRLQKKDGSIIEAELTLQTINFDGRRARLTLMNDVTEQRQAERKLQESQQLVRLMIDTLPQAIWWKDSAGVYKGANSYIARVAGFDSPEKMLGLTDYDMPWTTEEAELYRKVDRRVMKSGVAELDMIETQLQHDGRQAMVTTNKVPLRNAEGEIVGVLGTFADITEQRRAVAALRESEYKLRTLLKSMREGLLQVDGADCVNFVNDCFCEMVDYSSEELMGTDWTRLVFDSEGQALVKEARQRRRGGVSDSYELCLRKKSGERLWVIVGGAPTLDAEGAITGSMGVFTDITTRKRAEEQLLHDAFHDGLTGLANRTLFNDHLQMTIERIKRDNHEMFAVLFLDFDRFKVVNDSLGHAEGDNLLKQIAKRLESSLRSGDLVARLGGDEFTVLLNKIGDSSVALRVAERIQKSLKIPFEIGGGEIFISASIGIALSTTGHDRAEDMLRDADIAMYRAKAKGKAQHQVFDREMHEQATKQLRLETEMRQALEREEFILHYQPIINLETEDLVGFEALVRWKHPTRGMIPPFEFIGAAEENNLILPLGRWIMNESCRQLRFWQKDNPAAAHLSVSVNLSSKQFLQPDLAEQIAATLAKTKLDPQSLKIEITESHIMENTELAIMTMDSLRELGVELSLDDFGTGYSSLSYLHRLPVSYLKIDRSFVNQMIASEENSEIVHTIIKLGKNLKMKVVAEGIETSEQLAQLKLLSCEYGQGYFFAKPLEAAAAQNFIEENAQVSV